MFGPTFTPGQQSKLVLPAHGLNGTIPALTTQYVPFFLYGLNALPRNFTPPLPGVSILLQMFLNSAQPGTGTLVVALSDLNVPTAQTFTIPAGAAAGLYLTTIPYAFTPNSSLSVQIVNNANVASGQINAAVALALH